MADDPNVQLDLEKSEEASVEFWDRRPGEPKQWFLRFQRYFLYSGLSRSVRKAFLAYLKECYPAQYATMSITLPGYGRWVAMAKEWQWRDRAEAWDEVRNQELRKEVMEASRYLMSQAHVAAEALVQALTSPRLTVQAANAILDRIGLPAISRTEVLNADTPITADDLAKVQEAVRVWEQGQFGVNG